MLLQCPTLPGGLESRKLGFLLSQNQYRNSLLWFSDKYSTHIFGFFKPRQKKKYVLGIDRPYKLIHETKHVKKLIKEKAGGQKGEQKNKVKYMEREVHRHNKTTEIFPKLKF